MIFHQKLSKMLKLTIVEPHSERVHLTLRSAGASFCSHLGRFLNPVLSLGPEPRPQAEGTFLAKFELHIQKSVLKYKAFVLYVQKYTF